MVATVSTICQNQKTEAESISLNSEGPGQLGHTRSTANLETGLGFRDRAGSVRQAIGDGGLAPIVAQTCRSREQRRQTGLRRRGRLDRLSGTGMR
jgi:hypothetical protein